MYVSAWCAWSTNLRSWLGFKPRYAISARDLRSVEKSRCESGNISRSRCRTCWIGCKSGCERVEFYTEAFAASFETNEAEQVFASYQAAVAKAVALNIEVNAGHDLDLKNLPKFLTIPSVLEVSIGHVLTVECIEQGMNTVVAQYLDICNNSAWK